MTSPLSYVAAAFTFLASLYATTALTPDKPFMTIDRIEQQGETVYPYRTLHREAKSDFHVTVREIGSSEPVCWTVHGNNAGEGWWEYEFADSPKHSDPLDEPMPLDRWVAGGECWVKLIPGREYSERTTWTPLDGSRPITYERTFTR